MTFPRVTVGIIMPDGKRRLVTLESPSIETLILVSDMIKQNGESRGFTVNLNDIRTPDFIDRYYR